MNFQTGNLPTARRGLARVHRGRFIVMPIVPGSQAFTASKQKDVNAKLLGYAELRSIRRPKPETSGLEPKAGHDRYAKAKPNPHTAF